MEESVRAHDSAPIEEVLEHHDPSGYAPGRTSATLSTPESWDNDRSYAVEHSSDPLLQNSENRPTYSWLFEAFFSTIKRGKIPILVFWIAMISWGAATGFEYIEMARDNMAPPKGSVAFRDQEFFAQQFPQLGGSVQLILVVGCNDDHDQCSVACRPDSCRKDCSGHNELIKIFSENATRMILEFSRAHNAGYTDTVLGYYPAEGTSIDSSKCTYVSKDGARTFIVFSTKNTVESRLRYMLVEYVVEEVVPLLDETGYHVGVTGMDPIMRDGSVTAIKQSALIDMISMPFAFALLAYMIRSWRLLLLSLFNMAAAILASLGLLNALTALTQIYPMSITATFVEVLGLAMGVDYSLFLLRRFRDECESGKSVETATKIMLHSTGNVVVVSALTIIFAFSGFLFMRSTDLLVQGMACVVIITCCLVVNLSATPAMILCFPNFFGYFPESENFGSRKSCILKSCKSLWCTSQMLCCCFRLRQKSSVHEDLQTPLRESEPELSRGGAQAEGLTYDLNDDNCSECSVDHLEQYTATKRGLRGGPYRGHYFRLLLKITKSPYNFFTLGVIFLIIIPFAFRAFSINRQNNILSAIPRNSKSAEVYKELVDHFGGGALLPTFVMVTADPDTPNSIIHHEVFLQLVELTQKISERTDVPMTAINSIAMLNGKKIPYLVVKNHGMIICTLFPLVCGAYEFLWNQTVNTNSSSALITISIPFDTLGSGMETFVTDLFDVVKSFQVRPPVTGMYVAGTQVGMVEDMRISFSEFPLLIGLTCLVVFGLIGISLRSVFVIARLSLTVILPLAGVFGLGVLIFQDGILNWTGIDQLQGSSDGFYWYVPLLTFTITIGLALDYDIFLILRIREHRFAGLSIRAAILRSMWEASSTILAAGVIMFLAFGSLMISSITAVNQTSFILATSVLFDAFIVQSIVVPCILSIADSNAWWPMIPPTENTISIEEEIEARNSLFGIRN